MPCILRITEIKGKDGVFKFDRWHFSLNNSLPFVNQDELKKGLHNTSPLAHTCHSGQQILKYKTKTQDSLGQGEDTAQTVTTI